MNQVLEPIPTSITLNTEILDFDIPVYRPGNHHPAVILWFKTLLLTAIPSTKQFFTREGTP